MLRLKAARVSVLMNKVKAAKPFMTGSEVAYCHVCHTLLSKAVMIPPRFKERERRLHFLMEEM